ncbi:MAG TPA: hypothetical protein VFU21_12845, partial [Kofleriaceae bacterium]|nr:hypothetical protein [Kofleriaceae bacterium]
MNLRSLFFLLGITAAACEGERGEMGEPGAPGEMGEPGEPGECGAAGELHVPGPSAFPEGIAAAPDGALYVGSLTSGEVVAFDPCDAAPRRFADVGDASAVGMLADAESDALWVCAADA